MNDYTVRGRTKKEFLVKIQDDSYSSDVAGSEYDNQIALSLTNVKGGGTKFKNCVCNKKLLYWFVITIFF